MMNEGEDMLTTVQVAEKYGVTAKTVTRWCRLNYIEAQKYGQGHGGLWLIPRRALRDFTPPDRRGGRPRDETRN